MNKKISTVLLTGTACLTALAQDAAAPLALPAQAVFSVQLTTEACAFDVRLNDVPLAEPFWPKSIELSVPAGQWLLPGRNVLLLVPRMTERRKANASRCKASAAVQLRGKGQPASAAQTVAFARWPSAAAGKSSRFTPVEQAFTLPATYPTWSWVGSERIAPDKRTRQALIGEYGRLWEAARKRAVPEVLPVFAERNRELAVAFHVSEAEMTRRAADLDRLSKDPKLELFPLEPEDAELVVFAGGRLAKLTRWDGTPMIGFNYKEDSGSETFDVVFRRSGDRWVVAR